MVTTSTNVARPIYVSAGISPARPRDSGASQGGVIPRDITPEVEAARTLAFAVQHPPQDFCIATIQQCLSPKNGLGGLNFVIEEIHA